MAESAPRSAPESARPGTGATHRGPVVVSAVALVVALVALAVAGWAALSGGGDGGAEQAPTYSDEERAAAGQRLCAAVDTVRRGVSLNVNAAPPGGEDDVAGGIAVMANARLALSVGGQYLLSEIGPATPEELAGPATDLARKLIEIGAAATAGVPVSDPQQRDRMETAEKLTATLVAECARD